MDCNCRIWCNVIPWSNSWRNREGYRKRHPTVRKGALVSAHAQVIGPVEIGENAKVGAAAVVLADVPADVTVVGMPAKIVRVHGKKMSKPFMIWKAVVNTTQPS